MFKKIKEFFLKIFARPLIEEGADVVEAELIKLSETRPKLVKLLVVTNYTAAMLYGKKLVESTETDLDDKALEEFIDVLSHVATKIGLDLSTIDIEDDEAMNGIVTPA